MLNSSLTNKKKNSNENNHDLEKMCIASFILNHVVESFRKLNYLSDANSTDN